MARLTVDTPVSDEQWNFLGGEGFVSAFGTILTASRAVGVGGWIVESGTKTSVAVGTIVYFTPQLSGLTHWWLVFDVSNLDFDQSYDLYVVSFRGDLIEKATYDEVISVQNINFCQSATTTDEGDKGLGIVSLPIYQGIFKSGLGHVVTGQYIPNDKVNTVELYYMNEVHRSTAQNSFSANAVGPKAWSAYFGDLTSGIEYASKIIAESRDYIKPAILAP